MQIALLGTGHVGAALGRAFSGLGHAVVFGSRTPDAPSAQALSASLNAPVRTLAEAVAGADMVVLAVPLYAADATFEALGDLRGVLVLDTMNPVGPGLAFAPDPSGASVAERVAARFPQARVVKAFHTMAAEHMGQGVLGGQRIAHFVCGDDPEAKAVVSGLATALGFEVFDVGGLQAARMTEPLALTWITLALRQGYGRAMAFTMAR